MVLSRRAISRPRDHLGQVFRFGDGSGGRIYRETVAEHAAVEARRDDLLRDPSILEAARAPGQREAWWWLTAVEQPRP